MAVHVPSVLSESTHVRLWIAVQSKALEVSGSNRCTVASRQLVLRRLGGFK